MKRYNLSKIMKEAHQIKKYMKLYSLTHGVKTVSYTHLYRRNL